MALGSYIYCSFINIYHLKVQFSKVDKETML